MSLLQKIYVQFKSRGLSINAEAVRALERILSSEPDADETLVAILDQITERIEKREIVSSVIDKSAIETIAAFMTSTDEDINMESTELFNAFSSPRIEFDERLKTFKIVPKPKYTLYGSVESRAKMFRERLLFTQQRLLRTGEFALKGMSTSGSAGSNLTSMMHELSTVDSLLGDRGTVRVLLGMLTQPEEGVWHLEDLTASIPISMAHTAAVTGLITAGCIVVVEGRLIDGVFHVELMGLPPAEERSKTLNALGTFDVFGTGLRPQEYSHLLELEESAVSTFLVILSDVQLDRPQVLEKLNKVLEGFSDVGGQPIFVLMGTFISQPISAGSGPGGKDAAVAAFKALADMICKYPSLQEDAKFILIPGPQDPGMGAVMPLRPLPKFLSKELTDRVKHVNFASNPTRLRFYTQEIVFFREDLLRKLRRHAIASKSVHEDDEVDVNEQLVETLLRQGHLCPLPLEVRPIYWELDYSMRLFPLPDLLILADRTEQFALDCWGCNTVNPGSFSSDFSFLVYRPSTKSVEFSRVD